MRRQQTGFTLIELVVVIVILGILAATALPRFVSFQKDARVSAVNGMSAALKGASALAHATALVKGETGATGSISMEGANVSLAYGYPVATAGGIDSALASYSGFNFTSPDFLLADSSGTSIANCKATYTAAVDANTPATVATTTSGC